ncbi:MAG: ATP-binding protein [Clostridia bacterium]|nr:ATP-binding protein [Clostridia bacterium]
MDIHVTDKQTDKSKMRFPLGTKVFMSVIIAFVIVACALFIRIFDTQIYRQCSYSLRQTTEKVVEVVNRTVSGEWERLSYVSYTMSKSAFPDTSALLENISETYRDLSTELYTWKLSCVDNWGRHYTWDGNVVRWALPEILLDNCPQQQLVIMETGLEDAEQMILMYRLPQPIELTDEDIDVTHILITLDMEDFGKLLAVSAFENHSYSYITDQNGMRLYHQQNQSEFMSAYNIPAGLQNAAFLYDASYEGLSSALENGASYTFEIEREDGRYFVSYSPLAFNNWNLFLIVPEIYVRGDTTQMVQMLMVEIMVIALLIVLLISLFLWTNSRQTLARQQLAVEEARSASQEKSNFLSRMSHDIRTPLNGIMGMCHIAGQNIHDPEAVADCLEKINISSGQLMSLVNDVLDMTRIEHGRVEINNKPTDLCRLLKECTVHIEAQTKENKIIFEKDISALKAPYVMADEVLLNQIITNLLGNAVKFTPEGGHIWLRVFDTESGYCFEVEDTGIGMKQDFIPHLFEPFMQENGSSRTKYKGTGLGLSIVKSLVEKMGGEISVHSIYGKGSRFTAKLPLAKCDASDIPTDKEEAQPLPLEDVAGMRVLLVEDNEINLLIAKTILEDFQVMVDTADNGKDALERFEASPMWHYELILMDLRMPVMDGIEACSRIRSLQRTDAVVPIVALTADAFASDEELTRKAGMNDHLSKPINIAQLCRVLQKYRKQSHVE